jgi:hypothetical protein
MMNDPEILAEALDQYAAHWREFAQYIRQPDATSPDGNRPTDVMMDEADEMADQCEKLAARAKEKVDSPIILLQ